MLRRKYVRFTANFILPVVETVINEQGELVTQQKKHNIKFGDTYPLVGYDVHGTSVTLQFDESSPIKGTAPHVEKDYCELRPGEPLPADKQPKSGSGCGGCGK